MGTVSPTSARNLLKERTFKILNFNSTREIQLHCPPFPQRDPIGKRGHSQINFYYKTQVGSIIKRLLCSPVSGPDHIEKKLWPEWFYTTRFHTCR